MTDVSTVLVITGCETIVLVTETAGDEKADDEMPDEKWDDDEEDSPDSPSPPAAKPPPMPPTIKPALSDTMADKRAIVQKIIASNVETI